MSGHGQLTFFCLSQFTMDLSGFPQTLIEQNIPKSSSNYYNECLWAKCQPWKVQERSERSWVNWEVNFFRPNLNKCRLSWRTVFESEQWPFYQEENVGLFKHFLHLSCFSHPIIEIFHDLIWREMIVFQSRGSADYATVLPWFQPEKRLRRQLWPVLLERAEGFHFSVLRNNK